MFCPKCHTELEDDAKVCRRCGTEQLKSNNRSSLSSFTVLRKFKTNTHEKQYDYSKDYSNVSDDTPDTHEEQYDYNKKYSSIKKDNNDPHEVQYDYSKKYSNVQKDNNEHHQEQYNYSQQYSNTEIAQITSDEDYIKEYVGNNYINIKKNQISIPALLLGVLYLFYRKLDTLAILLTLLIFGAEIIFGESIRILVQIIIHITLMYKFNKLYLDTTEKKVNKIKEKNIDKSSNELLEICKNEGKTRSEGKIIFIFFLIITTLIVISVVTSFIDEYDSINIDNENIDIIKIKELEIKIPNDYSNHYNFGEEYYRMNYHNSTGTCYVTIQSIKEDIINYNYYNPYNTEIVEKNNMEWKKTSLDNIDSKIIEYRTNRNNITYTIDFESKYTEFDACEKYNNEIMDNINIKERQ